MAWVPVINFDEEVKIGDLVKSDTYSQNDAPLEVTAIGKNNFIYINKSYPNRAELLSPKMMCRFVFREPKRWRTDHDKYYFFVSIFEVRLTQEVRSTIDEQLFEAGNYWRTEEQAKRYQEECKKLAYKLHEEFGE